MTLTFNMVLQTAGVDPEGVRLLRHAPAEGRLLAYRAWHDDLGKFETYQSAQARKYRKFYSSPYWASFVVDPSGETLFVGLYEARFAHGIDEDFASPLGRSDEVYSAGGSDRYHTRLSELLGEYRGKLVISWGGGVRTWAQYADRNDKVIVELRRDRLEEDYPGHSQLIRQLSEVEAFPEAWRTILSAARGVYLLTCPRTKEQYVGKADGVGGFYARWLFHAGCGGDAIALRSRDPADYRVSILEVAGSLASSDDISAMESRWKEKLQSREMGLNRN